MEKNVSLVFPTPIGEFIIPECESVNARLAELILERERTEPNRPYANAGGWHSGINLLDWPGPEIVQFRNWMAEAVNHMIASTVQMMKAAGIQTKANMGPIQAHAWANVSRYGNYHRTHNHPGNAWSGAYYVTAGKDSPENPLSGMLELADPRPFANMCLTPGNPFGQKILVRPLAGKMIVFPSWLEHFVHPYFGEGERISIAFNVRVAE